MLQIIQVVVVVVSVVAPVGVEVRAVVARKAAVSVVPLGVWDELFVFQVFVLMSMLRIRSWSTGRGSKYWYC